MKSKFWIGFSAVAMLLFIAACVVLQNLQADDKKNDNKDEKVIKKDSGLKYVELKEGEGPGAKPGDTLEVVYSGWLQDGKQFDSNVGNEPLSIVLGKSQVIPGWLEGLGHMKAGGKRRLIVPPNLGYGAAGNPPDVPPNAVLYFDIEVIKITPRPETPPG